VKFLSVFLLLAMAAGAQTAPPAPSKPAAPARQAPSGTKSAIPVAPDEGTINGRIYTSDYFGFNYTLPDDYEVESDPTNGEEDASHRSFVLLAAQGSGQQQGNVLVIMVDQAAAAGVTEAATYLTKVSTELLKRQGFTPQNPVRQLTLAERKFARADFTRANTAQTVLVTMLRGYAVNFVLMGPSREDVDRLIASLDSLRFAASTRAVTKPPAASPAAPTH
jgi:hypothetical protein